MLDVLQHRSFEVSTRAASNRTLELSWGSEALVDRGDYYEQLAMDPQHADLSRLNDGAHPLLLNHNTDQQIGCVESAKIVGRRGVAKVRFGTSKLASEIWDDVTSGIRSLCSFGYQLTKQLSETVDDSGKRTIRFAFSAFEISVVGIPADPSVGIGRALPHIKIMSETYTTSGAEIRAIAKHTSAQIPNSAILAERAIAAGHTVEQFRAELFSYLPQATPVTNYSDPLVEVKPRDWQKYSISRAILGQLNGRQDGIEGEFHREISLKQNRKAEGVFVPDQAFRSHVAGTATLGGFLVQNTVASNEFIELLRNRSQVMALGARVLELNGPTFIPRQAGAGTASWVAETTASTLSATNFTNLTLTPKAICAQQQYSKLLVLSSNPSIDSLIRDDLIQTTALGIDLACLHGGGTTEPVGIAGTAGIGTVNAATDGIALSTLGITAYAKLVALETAVAGANADTGSLAYLMRSAHRGALRTSARFASTDTPIFDPTTNKVNSYRTEISNSIATNLTTGTNSSTSCIFYGNWADAMIANFGAGDLVVDEISLASNRCVKLYYHRFVDFGVRNSASFAVLGGLI